MSHLNNIFLYEFTPEAIDAVKSGTARISSGGIIKVGSAGKGFRELARPASMSVADFESLFEGKEHALQTDERLRNLDSQLALSAEGLEEIKKTEWLNYAATQRNYVLSHEGFKHTINGINSIKDQLTHLEQYVHKRDTQALFLKVHTYINYMNNDAGLLRSKRFSPTNGSIGEHLDQISALIKSLLHDLETEDGDLYVSTIMLTSLLIPFSYVVRMFSAAYFYENDGELMPGNYNEWVNCISDVSKSKTYKYRVEYYIKLNMEIPFRDKMIISKTIGRTPSILLSNIIFERQYIIGHNKEEYLSIRDQICQKIDYNLINGNLIIFLGS